ncbi:ABC-type spermidine/putrescine transport systems, ATPase components [Longilinea arvoryzae]|uniref:ABC-type quaternary amine transporter n=1 Tax=Longilinea arvoryzae TaxID=360412 RepID=A0A0S7BIU1_9CHLR|nr:ABC transporter ATP-binding protein [Longilinea arvoryzae]GAP13819.1 ABC-type spermidine/putrescine transport systems, ATPase components [Longilinea arvoryzae]
MLEIRDIWKSYENQPLLNGVSFQIQAGETVCLLGRSGSGKSTLLRIIAGLETAERGQVLWQGQDLSGVPVHLRHFGLMFQDYALFPHRNVAENVAFGLRMQGLSKAEIGLRVVDALEKVNLAGFAGRRVTDLSGGEQQRVALARALAPQPRLLMLDEPLGALDRALREQLGNELRRVLHSTGIPAIYVTHDQEEAFAIADRLVLLHEGRVEQEGQPAEIYNRPASTWVAHFLGLDNLVPAQALAGSPGLVQTPLGLLKPACLPPNGAFTLLLRPAGAYRQARGADWNRIQGRVEDSVFRGERFRVELRCAGDLTLRFDLEEPLPKGEPAELYLPPEAVLCLG